MPLTLQESLWALGPRMRGMGGMGVGRHLPQRNPYARRLAGMAGQHQNQELGAKAASGKQTLDSLQSTLSQIRTALTVAEPDLASDPSSAGILQAANAALSGLQGAGDALASAIPGAQQNYGNFQGSDDAWNAVDRAQQAAMSALSQYRDLPAKLSSAARQAKLNQSSAAASAASAASASAAGALNAARGSVIQTIGQAENALAAASGIVNDAASQGADTSDAEGLLVAVQADIGSLRAQAANAQDQSTLNMVEARAASAVSKVGTATSSAKRALATFQRQQALDSQRKSSEDAAAARADALQQSQLQFQQQQQTWQQQQQQSQIDYQRQQQDAANARMQAQQDAADARAQQQADWQAYMDQVKFAQTQQPPPGALGPVYPGTASYPGGGTSSTNVYMPDPYGAGTGYAPGSPGYFDANAFGPQYEAAGYGPSTPPPVMQPGPGYGYQQPSMWDPGAELFGMRGMPGLSGGRRRRGLRGMGAVTAAGSLPGKLTPGYTLGSFADGFFIITTPEGDQVSMSQDQANKADVQVTDQKGRVFYQGPTSSTNVADIAAAISAAAQIGSRTYADIEAARRGQRLPSQAAAVKSAGWSTGEKVAAGVVGALALLVVGPKVVAAFKKTG